MQFHTRARLIKHLSNVSPVCEKYYFDHQALLADITRFIEANDRETVVAAYPREDAITLNIVAKQIGAELRIWRNSTHTTNWPTQEK